MPDTSGSKDGEAGESSETQEWSVSSHPAVRAVLDHIAEELAAEFVRLMSASVAGDTEIEPDVEA